MQQILSNLTDITWWFNGLFFICVGLLIAWIFKKTPLTLRSAIRKRIAKKLIRIKYERRCASTIQYQISHSQVRFLIFIFTCFGYVLWFSSGSLKVIFNQNFILGLFLISPIYIFEIYWLVQDMYVKALIKHRRKLRITSH